MGWIISNVGYILLHNLLLEHFVISLYWLYLCASEQWLNLMSYTSNLNTYIWSYIQWIYKTNLYGNIAYIIPQNIRYLRWNTQYIAYVKDIPYFLCTSYDHQHKFSTIASLEHLIYRSFLPSILKSRNLIF